MLETHLAEVKHQEEQKIWYSKPKRTASLPSPHPVGLQSRCTAPLGSLPFRQHRAPAPPQIHKLLGSLAMLGPSPVLDLCSAGIPTPQATLDPSSASQPCSARISTHWAPPQALLGPSSMWDNKIHATPGFPPLRPQA
jgi:hypothetical protein